MVRYVSDACQINDFDQVMRNSVRGTSVAVFWISFRGVLLILVTYGKRLMHNIRTVIVTSYVKSAVVGGLRPMPKE